MHGGKWCSRLVGDKSLTRSKIKATPTRLVNDLTHYRQAAHTTAHRVQWHTHAVWSVSLYDRQMSPQSNHRGARADYVSGRPKSSRQVFKLLKQSQSPGNSFTEHLSAVITPTRGDAMVVIAAPEV